MIVDYILYTSIWATGKAVHHDKDGNDCMSPTDRSRGRIYMHDDAASRKSGNRTAYKDGVGSHEPCYHLLFVW